MIFSDFSSFSMVFVCLLLLIYYPLEVQGLRDGDCPPVIPPGSGQCFQQCNFDEVCPGLQKCCPTGCGQQCKDPVLSSGRRQSSLTGSEPNRYSFGSTDGNNPAASQGAWNSTTKTADLRTAPSGNTSGGHQQVSSISATLPETTHKTGFDTEIQFSGAIREQQSGAAIAQRNLNSFSTAAHADVVRSSNFNVSAGVFPQQNSAQAALWDAYSVDPCQQRADAGICRALLPRWFYDASTDSCREFMYGGCGGNQNNFKALELCEKICRSKQTKPLVLGQFDATPNFPVSAGFSTVGTSSPSLSQSQSESGNGQFWNSQSGSSGFGSNQSQNSQVVGGSSNIAFATAFASTLPPPNNSNLSPFRAQNFQDFFAHTLGPNISSYLSTLNMSLSDQVGNVSDNLESSLGSTFCFSTQHKCKTGHCIERSKLCDGSRDCPGGDDEDSGYCSPGSAEAATQRNGGSFQQSSQKSFGDFQTPPSTTSNTKSTNGVAGGSPWQSFSANGGSGSSTVAATGACATTTCPACYKCELNAEGQLKCLPDTLRCCTDGAQPQLCFVSPCQGALCAAFPNARCVPDYCGVQCRPRFYDEQLNEIAQERCSARVTGFASTVTRPIDASSSAISDFVSENQGTSSKIRENQGILSGISSGSLAGTSVSSGNFWNNNSLTPTDSNGSTSTSSSCGGSVCGSCEKCEFTAYGIGKCLPDTTVCCPDGRKPINCFIDHCQMVKCNAYSTAHCVTDGCNGCIARFYDAQWNLIPNDRCAVLSDGNEVGFQSARGPLQPSSSNNWVASASDSQKTRSTSANANWNSQQTSQSGSVQPNSIDSGAAIENVQELTRRPAPEDPMKGVPDNWRPVYQQAQRGVANLRSNEQQSRQPTTSRSSNFGRGGLGLDAAGSGTSGNGADSSSFSSFGSSGSVASWEPSNNGNNVGFGSGLSANEQRQQQISNAKFGKSWVVNTQPRGGSQSREQQPLNNINNNNNSNSSASSVGDFAPRPKPGTCPTIQRLAGIPACSVSCAKDNDCGGRNKCCQSSCGNTCLPPLGKCGSFC